MIAARLAEPDDFEGWRALARGFLARGVPPQDIAWEVGEQQGLFGGGDAAPARAAPPVRASRAFLEMARQVLPHRDPARLGLLYRLLWRLQRQPRLMEDAADGDVRSLQRMAGAVRRDIHKMRAFVRFRALADGDGERFASQRWSILTPRLALHWDGAALCEGPPARAEDAALSDDTEALWTGYYRAIFNPARLKTGTMLKEMPRRYWHNMPETAAIGAMIAGARAREAAMLEAAPRPAEERPESLDALASAAHGCRRCAIGCNGTRAVPGEGPISAALMIVGEQPGDHEEQAGRPFVGPAGQVLDVALIAAGIARETARLTNAVRHFKHLRQGKARLHQTPNAGEIDICRWWLDAERALVRPRHVLALGASAARGLLGRTPSVARERGRAIALPDGAKLWLTSHPSYQLRLEGAAREAEMARFREDVARVGREIGEG